MPPREAAEDPHDDMKTLDAKRVLEAALICSAQPMSLRELAALFADEIGNDTLRTLLDELGTEYAEKGTGPTVRVLGKTSGVSIKELYQLFPKGPAKVAAKIAGIPKPRGCI